MMDPVPNIAKVASLIGEPSRAMILSALLAGGEIPASELAKIAGISPQTTSSHLAKLISGGLLTVNQKGRYRLYCLKNTDVARALEVLSSLSTHNENPVIRPSQKNRKLFFARTCYDHLAGKFGVVLTQELVRLERIELTETDFILTKKGKNWLKIWDIDVNQLLKSRRKFAIPCLDWSEREFHIAGALGAAIANKLFKDRWIKRIDGTRALDLTETGRYEFLREFGINLD